MPYINQSDRPNYEPILGPADTSGQLNFQLTMVILEYLRSHGLRYETCNDIVGALDNCKDEFKRRIQHPYEDKKIIANGDVYD